MGELIQYRQIVAINCNTMDCPVACDGKKYTWTKDKLTRIHRGAAMQSGAIYDDCTFTYNGYGLRTAKSYAYDPNPGVSSDGAYSYNTSYCYDYQGRLVREYCTETRETGSNVTREFIYLYDESGMIGVMYSLNGAAAQPYYYHRNLQGDVVAIYDASGYRTVEYAYDAWGNCTIVYGATTDLAKSNPIRYRGYYYDRETGLYYLNSRYYSPEWRRFISPDDTAYLDPENVNGLNLYCYCYNDPINFVDKNGHMPKWLAWTISGAAIAVGIIFCATGFGGILGGVLIGAGAGSLINGYVNEANGGSFTAGYIGGAISGALCGVGAGLGGMAFAAATNVSNFACMGYLGLAAVSSFGFGFAGNLAGTVYTSWHNSGFRNVDIDWQETLTMSALAGTLNVLAGIGSGMSSVAAEAGKAAVALDSKLALGILSGTIAATTEALYDTTTYILSKLIELL